MRKVLLSGVIVLAMAGPAALAAGGENCQAMLDKAAAQQQGMKLDEATAKSAAELAAKAQELLKAGDEENCKAVAGDLLKTLGVDGEKKQ